ncbi:MAG: TIR domain-containing protein [Pseudonocardiaceae bacterium]
MARIFVSYAGKDLILARAVHRWLVEAGHEVFLDQDPRDGIAIGEQWRQRLQERLRWTDAVVCVVTSAAVVSGWCTAEIATAQSRGSRLLPLLAEPGVTHPLLTEVQHCDITQHPTAAPAALIAALRRIDAAGGAGWPDDRCPFPGLRPFGSDRHRVFFGRSEEIKQLAELVRSAAEGAALLVVGPSGCGKSSLVRAGLVPVMAVEPSWRVLPPFLPGADPVGALARELATAARRISLDWTVRQVRHRLGEDDLAGLAEELLLDDPDGPQRRLLVVVDQFEELLTQAAPGQRAWFAELLRPALTGPVRLVGTLRPEFLDQWLADPDLAGLAADTYLLRPLHREALRLVIEGPAQLAGIDVQTHLVARLIDDTDTGEALPLLAFTLAQLADGVGRGGQLSAARYDQLGGVQGALTRQADAALAAAVSLGGRSAEEVIAGLLRLVTVDEQGRPTRWRVHRDDLPASVVAELDAFVTRRLLTTDTDNGTVVVGVAHEAFLSAWPPLAQAVTANVTTLRARRAVEHAATEWHDHDRPTARLWGGGQLAAAVADTGAHLRAGTAPPFRPGLSRWLPRRRRVLVTDRVDLTFQAREFLYASFRRDRFRRRRGTSVLSVLLILALIGVGVAIVKQRDAVEQQRLATARQLVVQADTIRDTDPQTALRLGVAAERIHPGGEMRAGLVQTLVTTRYAGTLPERQGYPHSVVFAPDGRTLATGGDGAATLWNLTDPARLKLHELALASGPTSVAFAPTGNTLATGSDDGTVILWDVTDPVRPRQRGLPLAGHNDWVSSMAFSLDGQMLATGSFDSTVLLWDVRDPVHPRRLGQPLTAHAASVSAVAFSRDGRTLATAANDGTVILWDLTDPARPQPRRLPLPSDTEWVDSVAFAPEGNTLVTSGSGGTVLWDLTDPVRPQPRGQPIIGGEGTFVGDANTLATDRSDGTVLLWDVTDSARPRQRGLPLAGHTDVVRSMAVAPDRRTLATASQDGTTILWDLTDPAQPRPLGQLRTGHSGPVNSVMFFPDRNVVGTGSDDGTVLLWDFTEPTRPSRIGPPLAGRTSSVRSMALTPNGHTLATGDGDGIVLLWDVTNPAHPSRIGSPFDGGDKVSLTPDGHILATGSQDGKTILWDLADLARPRQLGAPLTAPSNLPDHHYGVISVAFGPDGRMLATGGSDHSVILWDLTDPSRSRRIGPLPTGHGEEVNSVAFSPDGRTLATGSLDRTVILWDLTDPSRPRRIGLPLLGHTKGVRSVAFAPDGNTLATASTDNTVILWDLTDLTRPHRLGQPLIGHDSGVFSVDFSPEGRSLATAGADRTVILWDLTRLNHLRDHAVERACAIAGGGLDRDEWAGYVRGLPYQDTCSS